MNCPTYDFMTQSSAYDDLFTACRFDELLVFVRSFVERFEPNNRTYDSYMCSLELFHVYCYARQREGALRMLAILEEYAIEEGNRFLESIVDGLSYLGEFNLARQYARRKITLQGAVPPPKRAIFLCGGYQRLLQIICEHDPNDNELPALFKIISKLAVGQYISSAQNTIQVVDALMPRNLVPPSASVILQSVWAYMKCDEAFGGSNYGDELIKIEAWLVQLSDRT